MMARHGCCGYIIVSTASILASTLVWRFMYDLSSLTEENCKNIATPLYLEESFPDQPVTTTRKNQPSLQQESPSRSPPETSSKLPKTEELVSESTTATSAVFPSSSTERHPSTTPVNFDPLEKTWRHTNKLVYEFRPTLARRHEALVMRFAKGNDSELIQLARDVIDCPPPPEVVSLGIKKSRDIVRTPQTDKVDFITKRKVTANVSDERNTVVVSASVTRHAIPLQLFCGSATKPGTSSDTRQGGFFVECGALDGERSSNTIWLEQARQWTGLLIEMDPHFYTQLLGKNRNVWSANVCLSPYNSATILERIDSNGGGGHVLYTGSANTRKNQQQPKSTPNRPHKTVVQCVPLITLLLALNRTKIDYLSLDVEGAELDVLKTIPWSDSQLDIDIVSVEYRHVTSGKQAVLDYMTGADKSGPNYKMYADLHVHQPELALYVDDFIFVKDKH